MHVYQQFAQHMILSKAFAFLKRDWQVETSYRFNFLIQLINSVVPLLMFFFIEKMISQEALSNTSWANADYFAFTVIGVAFTRYFQFALSSFSTSIRNSQVTGCLEAMFGSQTSPATIVLLSSTYSMASSLIQLVALLGCSLFLGFSLASTNVPVAFLVFFLSILAYLSFGILSATFTLLFKRGDPVTWVITMVGALVGGAYFPVDLLPQWLQVISAILPITYALDALRTCMLEGGGLGAVLPELGKLTLITAILLPGSLFLFNRAVTYTRRTGTLGQY